MVGDVKDKDFVRQEKILESQVFNYYVSLISKPYSGNYYSFAKNYIKNFSLPELNTNEKKYLITEDNKIKIDKFLIEKYDLSL